MSVVVFRVSEFARLVGTTGPKLLPHLPRMNGRLPDPRWERRLLRIGWIYERVKISRKGEPLIVCRVGKDDEIEARLREVEEEIRRARKRSNDHFRARGEARVKTLPVSPEALRRLARETGDEKAVLRAEAVALAKEKGIRPAAREMGVPVATLAGWWTGRPATARFPSSTSAPGGPPIGISSGENSSA